VQTFIQTDRQQVQPHTLGVRVMLLTDFAKGRTAGVLRSTAVSSTADDLDEAVAAILDDPFGYDLFVMECDGFGGIAGAEQAIAALIAGRCQDAGDAGQPRIRRSGLSAGAPDGGMPARRCVGRKLPDRLRPCAARPRGLVMN
jgi:hypothetical protein